MKLGTLVGLLDMYCHKIFHQIWPLSWPRKKVLKSLKIDNSSTEEERIGRRPYIVIVHAPSTHFLFLNHVINQLQDYTQKK